MKNAEKVNESLKILAVIPARYASSRFPGKPLALINGIPMIERVYRRTYEAFAETVVATDDRRIYDKVSSFGGKAVMTSPNHRSGTDRCLEAMNIMESENGCTYDVVVNVQGDEPYINPDQLLNLVECFSDADVEIATMVKRITDNGELFDPNTPKVVMDSCSRAIYFSRSPIPYCRGIQEDKWLENAEYHKHIGLYAYRRNALARIAAMEQSPLEKAESLEQLRWLQNGMKIAVAKTEYESFSVDTPEDVVKLEKYFKD